jgi:protein phosphatase
MNVLNHNNDEPVLHVGVGLDMGRARVGKPNQDSVGVFSDYCLDDTRVAVNGRLYAVADGMGGAAGGQHASRVAVEALMRTFYSAAALNTGAQLLRAIQAANAAVYELAQSEPALDGMGTTIVAVVLHNDTALIANVGDSRAYVVRNGAAQQWSTDHSLVGEHVRHGALTPEQAAHHPQRNIILRNLGYGPHAQPDITSTVLQNGDALVLCSDGVWGVLPDAEIARLVAQHNGQAAYALVAAANAAGGPDNIGVIVVRVERLAPPVPEPVTTAALGVTQPLPPMPDTDTVNRS